MSFRKTILSCVTGVAALVSLATYAGGYETAPIPASDSGYYVGGDVGYAYQDYKNSVAWRRYTRLETLGDDADTTGGFAADVNLGYKLNKNYAFELGWVHLPSFNMNGLEPVVTGSLGAVSETKAWMDSWALYLAVKYMMPLMQSLSGDLFFKVGIAYRNLDMPSNADVITNTVYKTTARKSDFVRPMFALGYERTLFGHLMANIQYAYFMGARNSFPLQQVSDTTKQLGALGTVGANLFTFGLAYYFPL